MGLGRVCRWLLVAQCLRESSAVSVSRSVPVVWSAGSAWCDVTAAINEVLPALPCAVAHLSVPAGSEEGVALIDPRILALGSASVVAPGALNQRRLSLAVEDGMPLLPPAARVVVFRVASPASGTGELHLEVECAASLVVGPPGLGAHAEFARAVLRAALADAGISPEAVAELEEQESTSAGRNLPAYRVYVSFLANPLAQGKGGAESRSPPSLDDLGAGGLESLPQCGALQASARRTAHHIAHLLREATVDAAADWYRNVDPVREPKADERESRELRPFPIHLMLDNVRSAYNVGSIFRTADTARVAEVVTAGFTPHPPHPKLEKTGFSAISSSSAAAIAALKAEGVRIYAMETTERSSNYVNIEFAPGQPIALLLGNEEVGVDTALLDLVDEIIEIPTLGFKNSLNIASAASIVTFEVLRQWGALEADQTVGATERSGDVTFHERDKRGG